MKTYCSSAHVLRARVDGRWVLLNLKSRRCYGLNDAGAAIWEGLEQGEVEETLVQRLLDRFCVGRPEATASVEGFLGRLATRDLITAGSDRGQRGA